MLKRKFTAAVFVATLFAGSAIAPAFAQDNGQPMQNDSKMSDSKMKDDKMKDDKMKDDKMKDDKMSSKKHRHRKSRKHKTDDKMQSNGNQ
jgi:pentapeptide MXKDX repeat protein